MAGQEKSLGHVGTKAVEKLCLSNKVVSEPPVNPRFCSAVAEFCEWTGQPSWFCLEFLDYLEGKARHE